MIAEIRAALRMGKADRLRKRMRDSANQRDALREGIIRMKAELAAIESEPSQTVEPRGFEVKR